MTISPEDRAALARWNQKASGIKGRTVYETIHNGNAFDACAREILAVLNRVVAASDVMATKRVVSLKDGARAIGNSDRDYHGMPPLAESETFETPYLGKLEKIARDVADAWGLTIKDEACLTK